MPAVAAVVAVGWTAASATLIFAAVAQVGLALTVVGAVTGNETLTKVGGALGLVGGVGGLVSGLGSAAASGAVEAGASNVGAEVGAESAAENFAVDRFAKQAVDTAATTALDVSAAPIDYSGTGFADTSAGLVDSNTTQLQAIDGTASMDAALAPPPVEAPAAVGAPQSPTNPLGAVAPATPAAVAATPESGWLSSVFNKDTSPLLAEGIKLIGGGLSGAEKARIADEKLAYEKSLTDRSASNANAVPSLNGLRFAPNPGLFNNPVQPVPRFSGLINAK